MHIEFSAVMWIFLSFLVDGTSPQKIICVFGHLHVCSIRLRLGSTSSPTGAQPPVNFGLKGEGGNAAVPHSLPLPRL